MTPVKGMYEAACGVVFLAHPPADVGRWGRSSIRNPRLPVACDRRAGRASSAGSTDGPRHAA